MVMVFLAPCTILHADSYDVPLQRNGQQYIFVLCSWVCAWIEPHEYSLGRGAVGILTIIGCRYKEQGRAGSTTRGESSCAITNCAALYTLTHTEQAGEPIKICH